VELNEVSQLATAVVPDRQLSLAIGREGQNARLAAKLAGWKVDIKSNVQAEAELETSPDEEIEEPQASKVSDVVQVEEIETKVEDPEGSVQVVEEDSGTDQEPEVAELETKEDDEVATTEGDESGQSADEAVETVPAVEDIIEDDVLKALEEDDGDRELPTDPVHTTSLRDLPEDVWSVRRAGGMESGQIRFAEDIDGLRSRGGRQTRNRSETNQAQPEKKRKTKAGKKRR
jgi:hypothetical protein